MDNSGLLDQEEEVYAPQTPSYLRFVEWILGALILFGVALTLVLAPGGNAILVLSISLLVLFYFHFSFIFFNGIRVRKMFSASSYRGIKAGRIIGAIAAGFALSICLTGIMFKLMFWEGSHQMMQSGLYLTIPVFLIGIIKYVSNRSDYYLKILARLLLFGAIGLILMQISWFDIKYRNHPDLIEASHNYNKNHTEENRQLLEQEKTKALENQ
ncbi:MAG: hypothetical protein K0R51_1763 [Cytophagaceae bacterium]|nr:hypothetical protein [Cytophagaceae bacterium]